MMTTTRVRKNGNGSKAAVTAGTKEADSLAEWMTAVMNNHGWGIRELARLIKRNHTGIAKILEGKTQYPFEVLKSMRQYLTVSEAADLRRVIIRQVDEDLGVIE